MNQFTEIEHKYIVPSNFDWSVLIEAARKIGPEREFSVVVIDHYYRVKSAPDYVYRHRKDKLIEELTIKSLSQVDSRDRFEVNLPVDCGDEGIIRAFLSPLELFWDGRVKKDVLVFEYKESEIVFYEASSDSKTLRCLEIEAKNFEKKSEAFDRINQIESILGVTNWSREKKSLLQLLFPDVEV